MAEKRLIDANELEEKAIYITGPKGSACHAVPLGLIQAAPTIARKRCDQRRTSSVDMYQKPKTVCSAMALQSLPWLGVRCSRYRVFQVLPLLRGRT